MKTLILGYGNGSRRDDGVGWHVIGRLAALALPGVDLMTSHQLEVELAETLTLYEAVIFVDAAIPGSPERIQRSEVKPFFRSHAVAHYLTPSDVLWLCQTLYGHEPEAILFSIRGHDFNFGTALSPEVKEAAGGVANQVAAWAQRRTGVPPVPNADDTSRRTGVPPVPTTPHDHG